MSKKLDALLSTCDFWHFFFMTTPSSATVAKWKALVCGGDQGLGQGQGQERCCGRGAGDYQAVLPVLASPVCHCCCCCCCCCHVVVVLYILVSFSWAIYVDKDARHVYVSVRYILGWRFASATLLLPASFAFVWLSDCLFVRPSVCLSVCLFVWLHLTIYFYIENTGSLQKLQSFISLFLFLYFADFTAFIFSLFVFVWRVEKLLKFLLFITRQRGIINCLRYLERTALGMPNVYIHTYICMLWLDMMWYF